MSIHVNCNWDGTSDPKNSHVDAVIAALEQNRARLGSRWTPPAFVTFSPADAVMFVAAQILDICGGEPTRPELAAAAEGFPEDRRLLIRNFLKRVFKRLEFPDE